MSSSKQRLASATATRLAAITDMAANLEAQLRELKRLRDQLRKAQLSARGFTNDRRTLDKRLQQGEEPTKAAPGRPEGETSISPWLPSEGHISESLVGKRKGWLS